MLENMPMILHTKDYIILGNHAYTHYFIGNPPTNNPKGTVLLLQGYGKKITDYQITIEQLTKNDFFVIIPDFTGQEQSHLKPQEKLKNDIKDYRVIIDDLERLLNQIILQNLPAPYYILADDMGAVFALIAHDLFANIIKRQVLVSPLFTPNNHHHNSFYHRYCHIISDLTFKKASTHHINRKTDQSSLRWYATILDAIAHIFSDEYINKMIIPTLVYLPTQDNVTHSHTTRQFIARLRMAQFINLYGAPHNILTSDDAYQKQFWQGFFAFIPGSA